MIIGFVGKKRSGKTEAAKYLSEKIGIPIYAFAMPLKTLVSEMTGLTDDDKVNKNLYTGKVIDLKPLKKELFKFKYDQLTENEIDHIRALEYYTIGEIYRNMLQYIGTNIFRTRNTNHWCQKFNYEHKKEQSFIIEDVRFKNEFNLVNNYPNAVIYKVVRKDAASDDNHLSETELESLNFDPKNLILNNSDNLEEYHKQLDKIFNLG